MKSADAMANAMKSTTRSMVMMNRRMNVPQLQAIMRSFGIETEKFEMTQVCVCARARNRNIALEVSLHSHLRF